MIQNISALIPFRHWRLHEPRMRQWWILRGWHWQLHVQMRSRIHWKVLRNRWEQVKRMIIRLRTILKLALSPTSCASSLQYISPICALLLVTPILLYPDAINRSLWTFFNYTYHFICIIDLPSLSSTISTKTDPSTEILASTSRNVAGTHFDMIVVMKWHGN